MCINMYAGHWMILDELAFSVLRLISDYLMPGDSMCQNARSSLLYGSPSFPRFPRISRLKMVPWETIKFLCCSAWVSLFLTKFSAKFQFLFRNIAKLGEMLPKFVKLISPHECSAVQSMRTGCACFDRFYSSCGRLLQKCDKWIQKI